VEKHEPHATFLNGRYRLDRLVVEHDDVTIWDATDMSRGLPVQLSVFERGSTVLHQGAIAGGMFVAIDTACRAPQLELVDPDDESFAVEPIARRRAWPWAVAGVACALLASAGWYASSRPHPVSVSEATITAATIPIPQAEVSPVATTPPPVVKAPDPPRVEEPSVVKVERRETPPVLRPLPHPVKPFVKQPRPQPSATSYDPLTI